MMRAAARKQELPALVLAQTRQFVAPLRVDFSEEVTAAKPTKEATNLLAEWKSKKDGTTQMLKLLQAYKDLGDSKSEPLLKFHNPRTFEDMNAPVPNFRAAALKAGEVGKFFDSVLMKRADDAVAAKDQWWAQRKTEVEGAAASKQVNAGTLPVPAWQLNKSVALDGLKKVTDAYVAALEPSRKLSVPTMPAEVKESLAAYAKSAGSPTSSSELVELVSKAMADKAVVTEKGKPLENFQFVSKAVAARVLSQRRAEVQERYIKMWAKKLLVSPELAALPLKDVDNMLASKFEAVAPQYAEILAAAAAGRKTLGERMTNAPAMDSFLLKREKAHIKDDFPPSEAEAAGAALAAEVSDPAVALSKLLGPELPGSGRAAPLSEQVEALTKHKYSADRYLYREGMKLAARLREEEVALRHELKTVYGDNVEVGRFQLQPRTPAQQVADRLKEVAAKADEFKAEAAAADNAYLKYAVTRKQQLLSDPTNIAFDEVLYPGLTEEQMDIELAELKELEMQIDDAEEEELWALTLAAQSKHIAKHFGVDLPHSVMGHMDPLLVKKIDWETTNGLEDWDITLEDMGAEYAKEQWGVEALSHHFLPLIRYRRMKARQQGRKFEAEQVAGRS